MAGSLMDQAIYRAVEQLVSSAEGIKRAVRATNEGYPALAGVDLLLRRELGSEYVRSDNGTWWAAIAVAQIMREMGYVEAGTARCPEECVAIQGVVWTPGVPVKSHMSMAK